MSFNILLLSTKVFLTKNVTIKNYLLVLYETMVIHSVNHITNLGN